LTPSTSCCAITSCFLYPSVVLTVMGGPYSDWFLVQQFIHLFIATILFCGFVVQIRRFRRNRGTVQIRRFRRNRPTVQWYFLYGGICASFLQIILAFDPNGVHRMYCCVTFFVGVVDIFVVVSVVVVVYIFVVVVGSCC